MTDGLTSAVPRLLPNVLLALLNRGKPIRNGEECLPGRGDDEHHASGGDRIAKPVAEPGVRAALAPPIQLIAGIMCPMKHL